MLREAFVVRLNDSNKFESPKPDKPAACFRCSRQSVMRSGPRRKNHGNPGRLVSGREHKRCDSTKTEYGRRRQKRRVKPAKTRRDLHVGTSNFRYLSNECRVNDFCTGRSRATCRYDSRCRRLCLPVHQQHACRAERHANNRCKPQLLVEQKIRHHCRYCGCQIKQRCHARRR